MSEIQGSKQDRGKGRGLLLAVVVLLLAGAAGFGCSMFGGDSAEQQPAPGQPVVGATAASPTEAAPPPLESTGTDNAATASITLNPESGAPGSTVTVQGQGFPANNRVVISLVPKDPPNFALNSAVTDGSGAFRVDMIVPSDSRWMNESPVPVLAEAVDSGVSAQAMLNITTPTGQPEVTPVAVGVIIVGQIQTTPQPPPPPSVAQLTATANVNIRSGPGTNFSILGVLLAGQQAEITGRNADATWWQIRFDGVQGGRGWVSAAYASAQNIGNVPIVNSPAPPPPPPPTPTPDPGINITDWRGEYWSNKDLSGPPTLVRNDVAVNFDWGLGSPDTSIPADYFSARWTRRVFFPAGTYRFFTRTDDGVRLWINNSLLINQWQIQSPTTFAADIFLEAGEHDIRMEYFEETLGAVSILSWQRVDVFPEWRAEYFNNRDLRGNPSLVRNEPSINYNWGNGSPAPGIVPNDDFSVRWTRTVNFVGGRYTFRSRSDDGIRVWLNNDLIIDRWVEGDTGDLAVDRDVPSGLHTLRVEYFERGGAAFVGFSWGITNQNPRPPLAVIRAPSEAVVNTSVSFDGTRSQNGDFRIVRWEWEFGDGATARGDRVSHTYSSTGEFRVRLKVTDERGYTNRTETRIRINTDPSQNTPPVAIINAPTTGKVGENVRFDGSSSFSVSPIVRWDWNFGDGIISSGTTQDHIYGRAGVYNVSLTVVAQNGLRNTQNVTIRIDDPISGAELPTAVINAPTKGIVGQPVAFDGSPSTPGLNSSLTDYNWAFGDGTVANAVRVDHTFNSPGTFVVSLQVINSKGLDNRATHQITIEAAPPPQPQVEIVADKTTVNVGEQINFTANVLSASNIQSYNWDFGDGQTGAGQAVSHVYNGAGSFNVTVTVADSAGQTASANKTITVKDIPGPPQPAIDGPTKANAGESVTFIGRDTRDPANTTPIQDFLWKVDQPVTMPRTSSSQLTLSFDQPGTYVVSLNLVDDRGQQSAQPAVHTIDVIAKTPQQPSVVINGPTETKVGDTVTFDANSSSLANPAVSVVWDFGDGTVDSSGASQLDHVYQAPGDYIVTLTITDNQGASGQDSRTIKVADAVTPPVPTPTPNPGQGNPPQAVFDYNPQQVNLGDPVTFDGGFSFGDNTIVDWSWDFGDGQTGNGMGTQYVYSSAGRYPVILTVTDDQGLTGSSAPQFVEVLAAPAPLPAPPPPQQPQPLPPQQPQPQPLPVPDTPTPDQPQQQPQPLPAPDTPTPEPPTLEPPTPTLEPPTPEPPTPTPEPPTPEPPTPTPEPPTPEPPTPTPVPPPPANPPVAGFSFDPPNPAEGVPLFFDGGFSYGDAPIVQWLWDFGDGTTDTNSGMGVPHIYATAGQYQVTLVVVDANGMRSAPSSQPVIVNPQAVPQPMPQPMQPEPQPQPK